LGVLLALVLGKVSINCWEEDVHLLALMPKILALTVGVHMYIATPNNL